MTDELVRVSASQIKLAQTCWRKWAFAYILKQREPMTRPLALGLEVHAILEAYLEHGTVPDPNRTWDFRSHLALLYTPPRTDDWAAAWEAGGKDDTKTFYPGKIALSMMPRGIFPAPGTGLVEHKFEWELDGIIWNGLIDWHTFEAEGSTIVIIDHKTSADPRKWGLSSADLVRDPQSIIYANAMMDKYGSSLDVECHWNYGGTDASPSKALISTASYTPQEAGALFTELVEPVGQEIRRLRLLNADPLTLEPNPNSCYLYNKPCPHIDKCNLTSSDRVGALIMSESLVDSLVADAQANESAKALPAEPEASVVNPPEARQDAAVAPKAPARPVIPSANPTAVKQIQAPTPPPETVDMMAELNSMVAGTPAPEAPKPRKTRARKETVEAPALNQAGAMAFGAEFLDKVVDRVAEKIAQNLLAKLGK